MPSEVERRSLRFLFREYDYCVLANEARGWTDESRNKADDLLDAAIAAVRAEAVRETEARYQEAIRAAKDALNVNVATWLTLEPLLRDPYPDAPHLTPWTRFGKRAADAAVAAQSSSA